MINHSRNCLAILVRHESWEPLDQLNNSTVRITAIVQAMVASRGRWKMRNDYVRNLYDRRAKKKKQNTSDVEFTRSRHRVVMVLNVTFIFTFHFISLPSDSRIPRPIKLLCKNSTTARSPPWSTFRSDVTSTFAKSRRQAFSI